MHKNLTLGSLFDGSGGFPLGGLLSGITPVWAAEIEPFPIRVTTKRLPFMKHYGDVSSLSGATPEPVDIITFGSPCQDMSVAGRRAGLDGSRSNLFFEAVRIVKEMREATNGEYPTWLCWENVPGAFSSNGGEDFKAVLDEIRRIKDPEADTPRPAKWPNAGCILADDYSVAWRVFDAQYWGVPQRRKRIYLVADLRGGRAGKVLFESEGLSGYTPQGFRTWQGTAGAAEDGAHPTGFGTDGYNGSISETASTLGVNCGMSTGRSGVMVLNDQGGGFMQISEDVTGTLRARMDGHPPVVMDAPDALSVENHPTASRAGISQDGKVQTLTSRMGTGGNNVPLVLKIRSGCEGGGKGALIQTDKSATLATNNDQTVFVPTVFGICAKDSNAMKSSNPHSGFYEAETTRTLDGNGGNPTCNQGGMAVVCVDMGGGKSTVGVSRELSPTLATTHGGEPVIAFAQNQRNEVRVLGTSAGCLAANPGVKQQTYVLQGSMIGRKDENGPLGAGVNEDVSFTLDATDRHAVAYGIDRASFNQGQNAKYGFAVEEELEPTMVAKGPGAVAHPVYTSSKASFFTNTEEDKASTLVATDYKDPPIVTDKASYGFYPQMKAECVTFTEEKSSCLVNGTNPGYQNGVLCRDYIVRRLTPTECARLQGFPDFWCAGLGTENPTEEDLAFWRQVFETHRRLTASSSKPKSDAQIIKWLQNPHSDSAEYKLWGNGIALPNACFVLSGIVWADASE